MTIADWLNWGKQELAQQDNPLLEAQILLAYSLGVERSFLYTWPDQVVSAPQLAQYQFLIARRKQYEPIAYLIGQKEFWSLPFKVTPQTLIPRPETELLIELLLQLPDKPLKVVDVGTGSGIIACALAKERPHWQITATDINEEALKVAASNAHALGLQNLTFVHSNWLDALRGERFNIIVSNPPYIGSEEILPPDLAYEPKIALISGPTGYEAFTALLEQCHDYLQVPGLIAFEHGFEQGPTIRHLMQQAGLSSVQSYRDLADHERITIGHKEV